MTNKRGQRVARRARTAILLSLVALMPLVTPDGHATNADSDGQCVAWMDPAKSPSARADALVDAMTLDQALHLVTFGNPPWLTYYGTAGHVSAIPELCIPDLVLNDAGSGVAGLQIATTVFPSGIAQASTWDPSLQRQLGSVIGAEAHLKGINVMLAPGMNIARTPFLGCNFEYFGEDPYLASRTAVAVIKGIQDNPVIADAKHYAVNNQETDRMTVDARVDERTMHEIYLPAFEASVKEAGVGSVMCAYNRVNGPYACESSTLLTQLLREDWGFRGFVVSD
jgi:beta-glucosidase